MAAGRKDIYKDAKPFKPGQSGNPNGNENSNGNALYLIVASWAGQRI